VIRLQIAPYKFYSNFHYSVTKNFLIWHAHIYGVRWELRFKIKTSL